MTRLDDDDDDQCSICMNTIKATRSVQTLECGHVFHGKCIDRWKTRSCTCPLCRKAFEEPKYKLTITIENTTTNETQEIPNPDPSPVRFVEFLEQLNLSVDVNTTVHFDIDNMEDVEALLRDLGIASTD